MIFINLFFLLLINLVISEYCNWSSWSLRPVCLKTELFCLHSHFRQCMCSGVMYSPNSCIGSNYKEFNRSDSLNKPDQQCVFARCYEFPYWCEWGHWIYNKTKCSGTRKRMCCTAYRKLIPYCLPDYKTGRQLISVEYRNGTCGLEDNFSRGSLEIPSFIQLGIGFIVMFIICSLCGLCFRLKTRSRNRYVPTVIYPRSALNSENVTMNQNNFNIPIMPRNVNDQNLADNPPSYDNITVHSSTAIPDIPPPSYESVQK